MESKRRKTQHNKESDVSLMEEQSFIPLDAILSLDAWKQIIIPFVGSRNFRFLGAVNKQFRSLYLEMDYSFTTTYDRILSIEQAQLFHRDIQEDRDLQEGGLSNWLLERHQLLSCRVMARLGRQNVLEYFHSQNFSWDEDTCKAAALEGNWKLVQWLHERGCALYTNTSVMCDVAAKHGDISMLQWLHERGCVWNTGTCSKAASHGHLNVLQWLRLKNCPWDEETCANAAFHGHLHVIQWARAEGCPWNVLTTSSAAVTGHLDVLVFALDHDCRTDNIHICYYAALYGELKILQYLHAREGFVMDEESIMEVAAKGNHIEIIQWLNSVNCPWDASACSGAAEKGNL